jgi:hypothetical protein
MDYKLSKSTCYVKRNGTAYSPQKGQRAFWQPDETLSFIAALEKDQD